MVWSMRIAVITESFLPRVNGVTNSVCRILEHFAARGHEALVIAPRPGPVEYAGHQVVSVPGVALPGYRSFVVGLPAARLEKRLRQFDPDVVHLASPITIGAAGASAARKLDLPCLAVFQTDVAGFARRYGLRGTDTAIWSWLRHIHSQADRTLVPSSFTLQQLEGRGIPRLAMWRRGVDAVRFHPGHRCEQLRSELAPNGETIVGYVGRLAGDKRVELLNHVAGLPGVRLVVVGDGPAASKLRASMPQAVFTGFLDGPELSRMYASLDVFVHTGADETFCQAVQEAMASGVPVVAAAAGGPLDLVQHERTGFLYAPDSINELRSAVLQLSGDPAMRFRFGALSRAAVEPRSWTSVGDQLLDHYRELVGSTLAAGAGAAA
jgi:phosphatidylinositol alpha 1,6-mannosyltransferase